MMWWGSFRCSWSLFHQQNFDVQWKCLLDVVCFCEPKEIPCYWLIPPSSFVCRPNGTSHPISLWFIFRLCLSLWLGLISFLVSLGFPLKNTVCICFPSYKCHIPHPSDQCTAFQTPSHMVSKKSNSNSSVLNENVWTFHMESAIIVVPAVNEIVQRYVCVIFYIHVYMRVCADLGKVQN